MTERPNQGGDTALSENTLSRRSMLAGIPGTALVTITVAPVVIAKADAEIFALVPLIEAAAKKYEAALANLDEATTAYYKSRPQKPVFDNELYRHLKGDEKRAYFEAWGPLINDHEERDAAVRAQCRVEELEKACLPLAEAHSDLLSQLAQTQALTMAGLRLKAQLAQHSDELIWSVTDDLLAMEVGAANV